MESSGLFFALGYRNLSRVVIAPEPFTEPRHEQILQELRALIPHVEFVNRKSIRLTCQVGTGRVRNSGHVPSTSLRRQMRELTRLGAVDMLMMNGVVKETISLFEQHIGRFVSDLDVTASRPGIWTLEVVDMRRIEIHPGRSRCMGEFVRTPGGIRVCVPRLAEDVPMADWANKNIRDLATAHTIQLLAKHGHALLG